MEIKKSFSRENSRTSPLPSYLTHSVECGCGFDGALDQLIRIRTGFVQCPSCGEKKYYPHPICRDESVD
jgi:hypothetical protein